MEFNIDPQTLDAINAMAATPYALAAKYLFYFALLLLVFVMVSRHNFTLKDALLALVGLRKTPSFGIPFMVLLSIIIISCFGLLITSMQVVIGVAN